MGLFCNIYRLGPHWHQTLQGNAKNNLTKRSHCMPGAKYSVQGCKMNKQNGSAGSKKEVEYSAHDLEASLLLMEEVQAFTEKTTNADRRLRRPRRLRENDSCYHY
jgi:hypothetical protein